jgi:hypothetical protein
MRYTYKDILSVLKEDDMILEFANLDPTMHQMDVDIVLHIMQPGDKQLKHGPRLKFFKKGSSETFSITVSNNPKIIGNWKELVSKRELNVLIENTKRFKVPFLNFWYDSMMTVGELIEQIHKVKDGKDVVSTFVDGFKRGNK